MGDFSGFAEYITVGEVLIFVFLLLSITFVVGLGNKRDLKDQIKRLEKKIEELRENNDTS